MNNDQSFTIGQPWPSAVPSLAQRHQQWLDALNSALQASYNAVTQAQAVNSVQIRWVLDYLTNFEKWLGQYDTAAREFAEAGQTGLSGRLQAARADIAQARTTYDQMLQSATAHERSMTETWSRVQQETHDTFMDTMRRRQAAFDSINEDFLKLLES